MISLPDMFTSCRPVLVNFLDIGRPDQKATHNIQSMRGYGLHRHVSGHTSQSTRCVSCSDPSLISYLGRYRTPSQPISLATPESHPEPSGADDDTQRQGRRRGCSSLKSQYGARSPQPQHTPRGMEKQHKINKPPGNEQSRDMLYYIQNLSGAGSSTLSDAQAFLSDLELVEHDRPNAFDDTVPLETSPVPTPDIFNMPTDSTAQPMLSEILQAVHKCMVSVDDHKERFGGA